jgi:hypothetical protein
VPRSGSGVHPLARVDFFDVAGRLRVADAPRLLARLARALDLARLLDLPPGHPDRMIAGQLTLYIGLAIIIAIPLENNFRVKPANDRFMARFLPALLSV